MKDKHALFVGTEPSKSELEILQVLWESGPCTVRFVNQRLNEEVREVQYNSTLKIMQLMNEKGLVSRDAMTMQHIYAAAIDEKTTKQYLLTRFVDTIFRGSSAGLILELLGTKKNSKKELEQIKKLVQKLK